MATKPAPLRTVFSSPSPLPAGWVCCAWCCCSQKRPATLCFAKQSSYELGTLAYRIITGSSVVSGPDLACIPSVYPSKVHTLVADLVAAEPGTLGGKEVIVLTVSPACS